MASPTQLKKMIPAMMKKGKEMSRKMALDAVFGKKTKGAK